MSVRWAGLAVALVACVEPTLVKTEQAPVGIIQLPGDGAVFQEGDPIEFVGKVADDGPVTLVEVSWLDNGSTVLQEHVFPDADGFIYLTTADLGAGTHAVALRSVDPQNLSHEASVTIEVSDTPDDPYIQVVVPVAGQQAEEAEPLGLEATVSDPQDAPEELVITVSSDLDGSLCVMDVDELGRASCDTSLVSLGLHRLTFRVVDTDGNHTDAISTIEVVEVPEEPVILVVAPTSGQLIREASITDFRARVDDRQDPVQQLLATVTSDVQGFLCALSIDSLGQGQCAGTLDVLGPQLLTYEVTDLDGNSARSVVLVQVVDGLGFDDDGDGQSENQGDCDDADVTTYLGAPELPDTRDNDCDGFEDEGTILVDDDGDGFCESLSQPCTDGAQGGDCDDANFLVNPLAQEVCSNGHDDNCSGMQDEPGAQGCTEYFLDADGDGYGTTASQCVCGPTAPYLALNSADCNDQAGTAHPGMLELPDGIDNDCDGTADEGTMLYDDDGDGYCESTTVACTDGSQPGDCHDANVSLNPGMAEVCSNQLDDNCDGVQDEPGALGCTTWYLDADGDGYGDPNSAICACAQPGASAVLNSDDCNDATAFMSPSSTEFPDGVDNNCDGTRDEGTVRYDNDGDGYCAAASCTLQDWETSADPGNDCNDSNPQVNPGAPEVCSNGLDDNCSGQQNEGVDTTGCTMWYQDQDNDGFGGGPGVCRCSGTAAYPHSDGSDCYDLSNLVWPGQPGFRGTHRGDGSFDYNCDGVEEPDLAGEFSCECRILFTIEPFDDGWWDQPACGGWGEWVTQCSVPASLGFFGSFAQCLSLANVTSTSLQQWCH